MKLEELLKDLPEVLSAVQNAIAKANEGQEDKLKHVRYADLSEGEYVSKAKFDATDAENKTNLSKLAEANNLIKQLEKAAKGDEALQGQVAAYQNKVKELENELAQTKVDAAIKVGLLSENAVDVDYLTYKLKEKGEQIELDEQGNIKGWTEKLAALKTQLPTMFTAKGKGGFDGFKPIDKDAPDGGQKLTKSELLRKPYAEQLKFYNENPDGYKEIMKG